MAASTLEARPLYFKVFRAAYPQLETKVDQAKCNVCHTGKTKRGKNHFGQALDRLLDTEENLKDEDAIRDVLTQLEEVHVPGRDVTYGELLHAGLLPTSKESPHD